MFEYVNNVQRGRKKRTKAKAAPTYKPKEQFEMLDLVDLIVEIEYVFVEKEKETGFETIDIKNSN